MRTAMYTCSVLGTPALWARFAQVSVREGLGNIPLSEMTGESLFTRHPSTVSVVYAASFGP